MGNKDEGHDYDGRNRKIISNNDNKRLYNELPNPKRASALNSIQDFFDGQ